MNLSLARIQSRGFLARWSLWLTVAVLALLLALPAAAQEGSYTYTVQVGDNWTVVAKRVGLTVEELRAANPQAVRPSGWLIVGEKLTIPTAPVAEEQFYDVRAGDGWTIIADRFDIPTSLLQAANARYVRPDLVLYVGDRLLIPAPAQSRPTATATPSPTNTPVPTDTPTPSATPTPTETPTDIPTSTAAPTATGTPNPTQTATATATPLPTDTPTLTPSLTPTPTATATDTPTPEPTATPTDEPTPTPAEEPTATDAPTPTATHDPNSALPACPVDLAIASGPLLDVLVQDGGSGELLNAFLAACGLASDGPVLGDLTGDGLDDLVIVYSLAEENGSPTPGQGDLLIANGAADGGYTQEYVSGAAGRVRLLKAEDINSDGMADVVWLDSTCGASTCFDTLYVRSWDGNGWQDWTDGTITMAAAQIEIADVDEADSSPAGSGAELTLSGGTYGSVGAGPQRDRTEVWASIDGAPYTLLRESYGESACLYHLILDANQSFAVDLDFEVAQTGFSKAIFEKKYNACWTHENELDELRSFAFFRLAQIAAYTGESATAQTLVEQLADSYPSQPYAQVGRIWLDAYQASGDPVQACVLVTNFVTANPAAVEVLADYGYANPTFTADDVCPILEVAAPVTEAVPAEAVPAETAAEAVDTSPSPSFSLPAAGESAAESVSLDDLPECPLAINDYAEILPEILNQTDPPQSALGSWLRSCDALTDDRGALVQQDMNGDSIDDLLIFPTIISDVGYGPGGADGAFFLFHGKADGGFDLVLAPDIFGQPSPVFVGDANGDTRPDLLWQVESCSTFCVASLLGLTWIDESGTYTQAVQPGAALASGAVTVEAVTKGTPGKGRQLRLVGGVSGTVGGGLTVPHTEIWQSIDAAPFRRISWMYDRNSDGNDCLGLRLVEADVALQTSDVLGYTPALTLYRAALEDSSLQPCSLFGLDAAKEMTLLQGLASFRLIQAQAFAGDVAGAQDTLAGLNAGQPESDYSAAASQWLEAYLADGDANVACEAVTKAVVNNAEMWQVTDQFGYDHPALAAQQVCFVPADAPTAEE